MLAKIKSVIRRIIIAAMNRSQYIEYLRETGLTIGEGGAIFIKVDFWFRAMAC